MRNLKTLDGYRQRGAEQEYYGIDGDGGNGVFMVKSPIDGGLLVIVASNGGGWDHVSVSRSNRCPNWPEMEHVKRMFFRDTECVVQFHVPTDQHINVHPHCLHLWRHQSQEFPRPPLWMVALEKEAT